MNQQVTINEFTIRFLNEIQRIGYADETIYRNHYRTIRKIARYYELSNILYYSLETTNEFVQLMKERTERGEIGKSLFRAIKANAQRMNEFFITGHLWNGLNLDFPVARTPSITTTLVYAHADTEAKRKAIEKAMGEENIYPDEIATFELNNEEKLKKLYGLK